MSSSIRETLSAKRPLAIVVSLAVLLCAAGAIAYQTVGSGPPKAGPRHGGGYYSTDDGQTWFEDAADALPPFDHAGKPAVRAHVFTCDGGKPFVGYLQRYTEPARKALLAARNPSASPGSVDFRALQQAQAVGIQVKRPGDKDWVGLHSTAGTAVTAPKCPNGKPGAPVAVEP